VTADLVTYYSLFSFIDCFTTPKACVLLSVPQKKKIKGFFTGATAAVCR